MARPRKEVVGGTTLVSSTDELTTQLVGEVPVNETKGPEMKDVAVGVLDLGGSNFRVVTIRYNLEANTAVIESVENAGVLRDQAENRFKMACVKHQLIKGR